MNLEVFKHKKAKLIRQRGRGKGGNKGDAVHMLIVKENIALRQNQICKVSTGFSLRSVACNKEKKGGWGFGGSGGQQAAQWWDYWGSVYLLITARPMLCGEGSLTATLLGSAV